MAADAFVFDRFAPPQAPARGSLLFLPPAVTWLPGDRRDVREAAVSDWQRGNALLDGVAWHHLRVGRASLITDGQADAIVRTPSGALIATGNAHARWIFAGFAPQDSNLPLQPGFPIFLGNALNWLTESEPVVSSALGTVRVPLTNAQIIDGNGEPVASNDIPGATVFDAARPDVYSARANGRNVRIVANVLDPRSSDVNSSRFADASRPEVGVSGHARIEPWFALVAIALLFVLIEWLAYARRIVT